MDYLRQFVNHLHAAAVSAMTQVEQARKKIYEGRVEGEY
jgi:hypothetical protein